MWKVVPICDYQKLDVRSDDLLNGGHFRKCETYRGGGGYDQFPVICERRLGRRLHSQFVVQLYGCNLDCPYCYVTRSGIWNPWVNYSSNDLIKAFVESGQEVLHLMGGAPAIYLDFWPLIIDILPPGAVFHSDFLLTEHEYNDFTLKSLAKWSDRCLFAVDIKGVTPEDYARNTRTPSKFPMFWRNLELLVKHGVPFYLTFTNPDREHYPAFCEDLVRRFGPEIMKDSFIIDLIDYDALPYVDILPARNAIYKSD